MPVIKPTIGRIVWYWPTTPTHLATIPRQPLPAIICGVWSDTVINIAGFDANGEPFKKTSVLLHQDGQPRPDGNFCEWMPYQLGQAAKTEALAATLDNDTTPFVNPPPIR